MRYAYSVLQLFANPQVQLVVHPTWRQPEIDSLYAILMGKKEGTLSFSDKAAAGMGAVGVE